MDRGTRCCGIPFRRLYLMFLYKSSVVPPSRLPHFLLFPLVRPQITSEAATTTLGSLYYEDVIEPAYLYYRLRLSNDGRGGEMIR